MRDESEIERRSQTYDDSYERILELLVIHLCIDIYTRQPATITGMGMIPSNRVLQSFDLAKRGGVVHVDQSCMSDGAYYQEIPFHTPVYM